MGTIDYSNLSERELEALQSKVGKGDETLKVFVADILQPDEAERENLEDRMIELENLINTFGGVVILQHIQKKSIPDYKTYIGGGKLDEIISEMQLQGANLLVLGNILKPHQMFNLNEQLKKIGAVAWDRVDLILKIFEKNAKTEETKLQIELAAIKHMGPRIFNMGMELGRQGGKGSGESNTEIMKRHLSRREAEIRKNLEKYKQVRETHRQGRKQKGFLTVGIVGYTNAGKSSLLNTLTNKGVLAEDKLFATLTTSVGKLWIAPSELTEDAYKKGTEVLLSDTIGFIRNLPPQLIDAFASTLEDSIESELLLHVVDASDAKIDEKIKVVDEILSKIGASQDKVYIFNKIDRLTEIELKKIQKKFKKFTTFYISTASKVGLDGIISLLKDYSSKKDS